MTFAVAGALVVLVFDRRVLSEVVESVRRRLPRRVPDENALLAELTALGLSAGLTFNTAVQAAAGHVAEGTSRQVERALRNPSTDAPPLFALAARALSSGAPLRSSIEGYASSLRREERSAAVERARRLPVKLMFPLALLILPGFVLLTAGPAVLAGIDRLGL